MEKFMNYILIVLVAVFFTSIVFYAATVFFPVEQNKCYEKYNTPYYGDKNFNDPKVVEEQKELDNQVNQCNNAFELVQKSQDRYRLILIGAINILVLIVLIFLGLTAIGLGLFAGTLLSSIIATIAYYDSSSKIALVLIVVVFVGVLAIISREITKNKDNTKIENKKKKK